VPPRHQKGVLRIRGSNIVQVRVFGGIKLAPMFGQPSQNQAFDVGLVFWLEGDDRKVVEYGVPRFCDGCWGVICDTFSFHLYERH